MNVLIPCAGLFKRFPQNEMPKYIRPLNDMKPMFLWSIKDIKDNFDKRYFAIREKDQQEWGIIDIINKYLDNAEILVLKENTNGPAHTIYEMLKYFNVKDNFLIHDCDCSWKPINPLNDSQNTIFIGWRETSVGDRGTKSWILKDGEFVSSIEEKKTPTDWYCCGGYQFNDPVLFMKIFEKENKNSEIFCSHIIQKMVKEHGIKFKWMECTDINDWGTYEKYVTWRANRRVYFIDLDGVLSTAGSPYGKNLWGDVKILPGVKEKLINLKKQNSIIYIITSRPIYISIITEKILKDNEIPFDKIIYDIPNGPRIMINDYSDSNPYPSVISINTKRNTADWIEKI